jgi:uncharacterized repeat protein (TIGR01451 family)
MNLKRLFNIWLMFGLMLISAQTSGLAAPAAAPSALTYYVSSSAGDDDNDGLTEGSPFETVSKINTLDLLPGDRVLFKCGDVWRADPLVIIKSGAPGQPITFGSYPADCADQPQLSGAQPISGWSQYNGNIYVAALNTGSNAGKFPLGVNQLFRGGERLLLGRWPNLDAADGGYSTIDDFPASNRITDNELPAANWTGAVAHIKGMRWYILNRQVTADSGNTLTLGANADCWGGSCVGWGYFLNNHLSTLDVDGEWFYDADAHKLYLYSSAGMPANQEIEASVVLRDDDRAWGGIVLGKDVYDPIAYVTIENFAVQRWYRHGITTPTNLHPTENHDLILSDNTIADVDGVGINLATWVWEPNDLRPAGWRGGYNQTISGNIIERANQMGINTYSRSSTFSGNVIRDVGLIENLGAAGMGCGFNAGGGNCTEDGDGFRIKIDKGADSGNYNTLTGNRLDRIAHNGMDIFGYGNTIEHNVIVDPCFAKGDCGGVRTFGRDNLTSTNVYNLTFSENIIVNAIGNTDGCLSTYDALFGFGLYIDHYSRDITVEGNTIISSTVHGILFQDSTGTVTNNTLYNNGRTYPYAAGQVYVGASPAYVGTHTGNILFNLNPGARTLSANGLASLGSSDYNYFFSPYRAAQIAVSGDKTLATWQAYSGKDSHSKEHWYTQSAGEAPKSQIFYNDTSQTKMIDLGGMLYRDLDQNPVSGSISLSPYSSRVLIESGEAADLSVSMAVVGSADTLPSALVSYTITVTNQGIYTATPVTVDNPIPPEIENTSWQAVPSTVMLQTGTHYTWEIASLAPGETYVFTVTGQYSAALVAGTPLMVGSEVSTPSPEINPGNNHAMILLGEWQQVYLPLIQK